MSATLKKVSLAQARRFLLRRQGLLGKHKFIGLQGAFDFIRQAGSIQFDPIDVCGRNPDLVLQSRIPCYRKTYLEELLYKHRRLVDYFDKELCIFPAQDWPHFSRQRAMHSSWVESRAHQSGTSLPREQVLALIGERGPQSSRDLGINDKVHLLWGTSRLARATLEHLYFEGTLGISHKKGVIKHYDLIERLLPQELLIAPDPHKDLASLHRFLLLRRIGAIGMLWNKASPAFLGFPDFKTPQKLACFAALEQKGVILPIQVDGIKDIFYVLSQDEGLLDQAVGPEEEPNRCELIAALDNLIWDRKLIEALFGFSYTWEIYTPKEKRKFGYYVLPILHGTDFIGRVEPVIDKKTGKLSILGLWFEEGIKKDPLLKQTIDECLARFEAFHQV